MIDYNEIMEEIERLEHDRTTYSNCEKLSVLYAVLDHMEEEPNIPSYSFAAAPSSEFLSAVRAADMESVLKILDEHMEAVKVLHPKEYAEVIRRINEAR